MSGQGRQPGWVYGMVLRRGQHRVMFVKYDAERQKMMGGGVAQFLGVRLDMNDGAPKEFFKIGDMGNYSVLGWRLDEDNP